MKLERKVGFYEQFIKRLLDIICSLLFISVFCWLYVIIAVIVRVKMGSPVLFKQPRPGIIKNGKETIFDMYKFRSMKVNAPDLRNSDGTTYNSEDDFRVTKIGRILRKTSLDETPQILNVMIGNMSFIGPRPDLPAAHFHQRSAAGSPGPGPRA